MRDERRIRGTKDERRETIVRRHSSVVLRKLLFLIVVIAGALFVGVPGSMLRTSQASGTSEVHKRAVFMAPLIWRAGGDENGSFKNVLLSDTSFAPDGSVVSGGAAGACELETPYATKAPMTGLSAIWDFTGQVTLEVSVTGKTQDYVKVINGVPLQLQGRVNDTRIKWRAALAPQSSLSLVRIVYTDLSGVTGSFGSELLSGFKTRKPITIQGSPSGELFQYQVPVKLGESLKSPDTCDLKLDGGILADFKDVRFTLADGETEIPHFLESVDGAAPDRVATFWIKVPEIPTDGLLLFMYFGHAAAEDISSGAKVFDLFEDFAGAALDPAKWKLTLGDETGKASVSDSRLFLEKAKLTTAQYKFASGVLEYQARISGSGAVAGILRQTSAGTNDLVAYSSTLSGSEHAIAKGGDVEVNDPKPITAGVFYVYRVHCDAKGNVLFQRYGENGEGDVQAEVKVAAGTSEASPVGLSSSNQDHSVECSWIRTRRDADPAPQVDRKKTGDGLSETVDLPEFYHVATAPDGSLVAAPNASDGFYISKLISPGFEVKILKPSWEIRPAGESLSGVGIATHEGGNYFTGWVNGKARYVSRKEFDKGNQLRWKAEIGEQKTENGERGMGNGTEESPGLKTFSLEFYPGTIRVVMPNGGETITPGAKYSIFWNAEGYGPDYPMEIAYSGEDGKEFKLIAEIANSFGDYAWDVPKDASGKAFIRVSDSQDPAVFGVSDGYFEMGARVSEIVGEPVKSETESREAVTEAEKAKEKEKEAEPADYELLVKKGDNTMANPAEDARASYKEGDIVMVRPAGYGWSQTERNSFYIVPAKLTASEVRDLTDPVSIVTKDSKGHIQGKKEARRKYKVDVTKQGLRDKKTAAAHGLLKPGALVQKTEAGIKIQGTGNSVQGTGNRTAPQTLNAAPQKGIVEIIKDMIKGMQKK